MGKMQQLAAYDAQRAAKGRAEGASQRPEEASLSVGLDELGLGAIMFRELCPKYSAPWVSITYDYNIIFLLNGLDCIRFPSHQLLLR